MSKRRFNAGPRGKSTQAPLKSVNHLQNSSSGKVYNKSQSRLSDKTRMPSEIRDVDQPCRVAKAIARAGLCSRREAERLILDGRVKVNGQVLTTPACVITKHDVVDVDGSPLPSEAPVQLWCYHKPRGLVTTHKDPEGRPTVFENLPANLPRVISVGRLDYNTEGLLLLTNSGQLARELELPATGWLRSYRVRVRGRIMVDDLERLRKGLVIDGVKYGPVEASIDSVQGANSWLTIGIREGKNREVRKILSFLGLTVSRLIRVSFGPFELGYLGRGQVESIPRRDCIDAVGLEIASKVGLIQASQNKNQKSKIGNSAIKNEIRK